MKAQKLGLVLGMNMAVACLVFQGCKVTKPGGAADMPPPVVDTGATVGETTTVPATTAGDSVVARLQHRLPDIEFDIVMQDTSL